jgi:hypothetical protein
MMGCSRLFTLAIGLAAIAASAEAAALEARAPFICSSNEVFECGRGAGCKRTDPDAIDAPAFLLVDTAKNEIRPLPQREAGPASTIERSMRIDNKLILQGAEDGREGVRDGLGWTLSVAEDTGHMVLTASGENAGFVIFGNCTALPQ